MSAFIVSKECMRDIIYNLFWNHEFRDMFYVLERKGYKDAEDFDRLYMELYQMNREAVKQRYNEAEDSDYIKIPEKPDWNNGKKDKYQALKSMHCLWYQCSEGDVPKTKMYKTLNDIIHAWEAFIIDAIPEYENARWD